MIQSETLLPSVKPADPASTGLEQAGDGKMWVDARYRSRLARAGLTGLEAVMRTADGQCLRVLSDRENWRLELESPDRLAGGFYLKKHHVRTWTSRLRATFGAAVGESAGRTEAKNVGRLDARGIDVMRLVAYGESLHRDGRLESFILTEELEGFEPLDDFLRRRFPRAAPGPRGPRDRQLLRLIRQVASVARRLHGAGYNHRDFYCCHFFVREQSPGEFEIRLIDLQRVERRRRFRRRWLIKDIAQLAYSAPRDRVRCTHKLAFVRHYLGVRKLSPSDKRRIRRVLAKQQLMERRRGIIA